MKKIYFLLAVVLPLSESYGQNVSATWGTNANTAWYTAGNWVGGAYAGVQGAAVSNSNIATFTSGSTGNPIGINMNTASLNLGAISLDNSRSAALNITNSSATAGVLRLYGATINGFANVILRHNGTGLLTLQTTNTMGIVLGNTIDNLINIDNTGGITINSIISDLAGGPKRLIKWGTGTGVLTLSGANTYSGGTVITSGTLRLGAAGVLADAGQVTLGGGTFSSGATTGFSETMGTLTMTDNSVIALGTGSHTLTFAASNAASWNGTAILTITGWTGTVSAGTTGTGGKIFFGNSASGLSVSQLRRIKFTISGVDYPAILLPTGELVPVLNYKITNISPATPIAGSGFSVTVKSQDFNGNLVNIITNTSGFSFSTNGNAGAISGTTTGSIASGANSTTVNGVVLSSAGIFANVVVSWVSGDMLAEDTSYFDVLPGGSPSISISGTPLSAFSANAGTPSATQSYNVSGSNLTNDIIINAPAGYEIKSPSTSFGSSVTLAQSGGTVASTQIDVRLNSNTAGSYNGNITHASTGAVTQNVTVTGTVGLSAPVANAPAVFTASSFTANWGAVTGATGGYLLDASAFSAFSGAGTLGNDGFENSLSLFTETNGTGSFSSGSTGTGDAPANSPLAAAGTFAYGKANGTVTITSNNINTSGATGTQLSFKLGSFSIGSTGNGADAGDIVTVEISPDGGTTYFSTLRVLGNSNAVWAYNASGAAVTAYDGNSSPVDFQPAGGGERTTDGYSTIVISGLPSVSNLKIRITLLNNNAAELWVIDDLSVIGSVPSFLTGYNGLAVAGTSQSVTVPGPGTYYYRVRATTGSITSANSNVITVIMNGQGIAPFRSLGSGDYNSSSTWEFNVSPPSYYAASTQAPGSTNDVTIQNGHTVTLTANGNANNLILQSAGNIILGTNSLTVNNVSGGAAGGYIKTNSTGSLIVNNITTSAKTLPVGNSTYNPLTIANGSGHNWSVRVEDAVNNVQPPFNSNKAVLRTWNITPSVNPPAAGADLTFQYDDSDPAQLGASYNTAEDVQLWHYITGWVAASNAITPTGAPGSVRTITKTGQAQFSPFAVANVSGPLPVTLLTFSGYRDGSRNQLKWTTASEANNRGFEVQRSSDGINYTAIGFVNSLAMGGNSSSQISYSFTDNAPAGDKQYYRLRQEDLNGQAKLSNIVLIRSGKPLSATIDAVFPNPARNTVNVLIASPGRESITLIITDMAGRNISRKVVTVETGSNTIPADISMLNSGSYLVRLVCSEGCETAIGKFVKQ